MNLLTASFILATAITASSATQEPSKEPPPNWQPVIGFSQVGSTGYFDANTLSREGEGKDRMSFVVVLLVRDRIEEVTLSGAKFKARSVTRGLVMECSGGNITPMGDLYYTLEFPGDNDIPVHAVRYDIANPSIIRGNVTSALYNLLCPNYI